MSAGVAERRPASCPGTAAAVSPAAAALRKSRRWSRVDEGSVDIVGLAVEIEEVTPLQCLPLVAGVDLRVREDVDVLQRFRLQKFVELLAIFLVGVAVADEQRLSRRFSHVRLAVYVGAGVPCHTRGTSKADSRRAAMFP